MELSETATIVATLISSAATGWALYQTLNLRTIQRIKVHAETLRLFEVGSEEHNLLREHVLVIVRRYCEPRFKMRRQKGWGALIYLAVSIGGIYSLRTIQQPWWWDVNAVFLPINAVGFLDYSFQWWKLRSPVPAKEPKAAGIEISEADTTE